MAGRDGAAAALRALLSHVARRGDGRGRGSVTSRGRTDKEVAGRTRRGGSPWQPHQRYDLFLARARPGRGLDGAGLMVSFRGRSAIEVARILLEWPRPFYSILPGLAGPPIGRDRGRDARRSVRRHGAAPPIALPPHLSKCVDVVFLSTSGLVQAATPPRATGGARSAREKGNAREGRGRVGASGFPSPCFARPPPSGCKKGKALLFPSAGPAGRPGGSRWLGGRQLPSDVPSAAGWTALTTP